MKPNRFFGDRHFYASAVAVVLPIIVQNGITNFVSLLDNVMVGRLGTEEMSGVAVVNQLMFIFNLFVFGAISGAGIFTAQFFGSGDNKGIRATFRFKLMTCVGIAAIGIAVFSIFGTNLISFYLSDDSSGDIAYTLRSGLEYLNVMLFGLLPFALTQAYAGTLRECGNTRLPMIASIAAVATNLCFNYILIFGNFGAPALGVRGAAIATVISRFVELGIIIIFSHAGAAKRPYIKGLYKSLAVPGDIAKAIIIKGTPLMINELAWSLGISLVVQCYSTRGLAVITAINISNTVANLFNIVFISFGSVIAIIVGQDLGANETEKAKLDAGRLITFSTLISVAVALLMIAVSPFVPLLYNTSEQVRSLATKLIICAALMMPLGSIANGTYFTIRSGGKTLITFLFDSVFVMLVTVPVAFCISRLTDMPIIPMYLCCQSLEAIKCIIGIILVNNGMWINNIVEDKIQTE